MRIKAGVKLALLQTQAVVALQVAEAVYRSNGLALRLTSGNDGTHKPTSLHYSGRAVDLGTKYDTGLQYPQHVREILVAELRAALGAEFDVVDEPDHIHVEYDPKN